MTEHESEIKRIDSICREMGLKQYIINDDLTVDVNFVGHFGESVKISATMLKDGKLPIQFGKVKGRFEMSWCKATSLEGCPKWVGGDFQCTNNFLFTLEGGPEYVGGNFYCSNNKLTSLDGCPNHVGEDFYCSGNPIGSISEEMNIDFIRAFNTFKVLKDKTINLKRLRYVMELFDKPIDLNEIKKYYTIS